MEKDWTGNTNIHIINHRTKEEDVAEHDFYATHPSMGEWLLKLEPQLSDIWEPACGQGHLAKVFDKYKKLKLASDLYDYNYERAHIGFDFLQCNEKYNGDIVTNPPYKFALEFCQKALELIDDNRFVCMFMKLTFLEGKKRKPFFLKNPPIRIYVTSTRTECAKNGKFISEDGTASAVCYAWYIWQKGFNGKPTLDWFN